MGFKVNANRNRTEESSNKTFRLKNTLIEKLQSIADHYDISLNSLIVQMLEYSLDSMDKEDFQKGNKKTSKK